MYMGQTVIKHLLNLDDLRVFESKEDFIDFVKLICRENGDELELLPTDYTEAVNYIKEYCGNFEIILTVNS